MPRCGLRRSGIRRSASAQRVLAAVIVGLVPDLESLKVVAGGISCGGFWYNTACLAEIEYEEECSWQMW